MAGKFPTGNITGFKTMQQLIKRCYLRLFKNHFSISFKHCRKIYSTAIKLSFSLDYKTGVL
jgi:hypothetical protein